MKVVKAQEGTNAEFIKVQEIQGDMRESASRMQLLQRPDGDVILSVYNAERRQSGSIRFCTRQGGGQYPVIAKKLRELIAELVALDESPWGNTSEIATVPAEEILPPEMSTALAPGESVILEKCSFLEGSRFHLYSASDCTEENPCCDRRGEYNGYHSGPLLFTCPKHCSCHD